MKSDQINNNQDVSVIEGIHFETGKYVQVKIHNGIVSGIINIDNPHSSQKNLFIAPGLIDNQVNGYLGINFADEFFTVERMRIASQAILKDGVTTFLPTLVTNGHKELIRNFRILKDSCEDDFLKDIIPGFHLEGPWLSPEPGFYGCHPVEHLRKPSWREFLEYQEAAGGNIIEVTISPELNGAMDFIKKCRDAGVVVAIGHTNASTEQINMAVEAGARLSTHLGNGCANTINRHRNPLWPQLANDLLTPSIIADGHHLLPEEIIVFYKVKGAENLILTSDVNHLIGMAPGDYVYMGGKVIMTEDGLVKNPELNCLAGASMPLMRGVENMMNFTGCSLGEGINLASRNTARIFGLNDRGALEAGKNADIIRFEINAGRVYIRDVYLKGKQVFTV